MIDNGWGKDGCSASFAELVVWHYLLILLPTKSPLSMRKPQVLPSCHFRGPPPKAASQLVPEIAWKAELSGHPCEKETHCDNSGKYVGYLMKATLLELVSAWLYLSLSLFLLNIIDFFSKSLKCRNILQQSNSF